MLQIAEEEDDVALLVRAWIEICGISMSNEEMKVALLVRAWIEIP